MTAIDQIRRRNYPASLLRHTGNVLLVGIAYNRDSSAPDYKTHTCKIDLLGARSPG